MDQRGRGETVSCSECGRPFRPREPHHRRCPECQRRLQGGLPPAGGSRSGQVAGSPDGRLPAGYLDGGYFDEAGNLRPSLLVDDAEALASIFGEKRMATSQLRRFFGKVRFVEQNLDAGQDFAAARSDIAGLIPHAANAVSRGVAPEVFLQFVRRNAELAMRDERSFREGFVKHFESIIGFYKYVNPNL